jgi:hypothetical protein
MVLRGYRVAETDALLITIDAYLKQAAQLLGAP